MTLSPPARAAVLGGTPVPVAGVDAFGIGSGQLGSPGGLVVDSKGDVFVADQSNNRVLEYSFNSSTAAYAKVGTTVAGVGGLGSGSNQLNSPSGVVLDAKGDLFAADSGNNRVLEYAFNPTTGSYSSTGTTVAGVGGKGSGSNQLSSPSAMSLDAKGDLFVADGGNNRVLEYDLNAVSGTYTSIGVTVAGSGGAGSGPTQLESPSGVALDAKGDLFVADSFNGRVVEYVYNSSTGAYASAATAVATLPNLAQSVAFDANGDLFVSYGYLGYNEVLEYAYNSATGTFASAGVEVDPAAMVGPTGIAFDSHGNLFVIETAQTSDPNQTVWDMVLELSYTASTGTYAPQGTVLGQQGRVNAGISAMAVDGQGDLFVSDTINNTGVNEFHVDPATGAYSPLGTFIGAGSTGLAVDSAGDVFIANPGNAVGVLEYAYNPTAGSYPAAGMAVPGATQLSQLVAGSLAIDKNNDLFVADGSQVLEFAYDATTGTYAATGTTVAGVGGTGAGASQLAGVGGVALDANGDLFVSDPPNHRIQEYLVNSTTGVYAANGITVAGTGGSGDGLNQLSAPAGTLGGVGGIAVDQNGDLFANDTGNFRVMEYTGNPSTATYSASGTVVHSEPADNWPEQGGVAVDAHGDLFFDSNLTSAVVYELPAASTPPPAAPTLSGITPASGPAAGGTTVTVTGSNLTGGSVVFGSTAATNVTCTASSCTATSPAGTGTVNVTVTTSGGTSAAEQFTYQAAPPPVPVVTGITPATGPAAGGTVVTLTGSNLTGGKVTFGSKAATNVTCTASSCTATSPAGTGTVNVTVTTSGGTSTAEQFTYQAAAQSSNLVPDPGFENSAVPNDSWGGKLVRSGAVVHSGSWSLAQTTSSSSGGWDLDSNSSWYAPISSAKTYTATIWVEATKTVKVDLNVDLLNASGSYLDSANGPTVTLVANTWTQLTITGIKPATGQVYAGMEPNFSAATTGTVIYWDDMSLTSP
ncbi:MAG: IPT/TIG domain-containing protein [Acidimicrobiales bacterium]